MCSPATCQRCGKTGWVGCGAHVDQVMAGVPEDRRCTCDDTGAEQVTERRRWSLFR